MVERSNLVTRTNNEQNQGNGICHNESAKKTKASLFFVLLTETLERFAFYGLLCNMALYLNSKPLSWSSYNAINTILIFYGISYLMTLIGGWLADAYLTKFKTVLIFFVVYIIGYLFWPSFRYESINTSCSNSSDVPLWCEIPSNQTLNSTGLIPLADESCSWAIFLSLFVISIGFGGVRANLVPFGASQIKSQDRHSLRMYFNWLYWCINIGSFLAYAILGFLQQNVNGFYGYLIPNIALLISFLFFSLGSRFYYKKQETGSPLSEVCKVLWCAMLLSCKSKKTSLHVSSINDRSRTLDDDDTTPILQNDNFENNDDDENILTNNQMNGSLSHNNQRIGTPKKASHRNNEYNNIFKCLNKTKMSIGGACMDEHVNNTKAFLFVCILFTIVVPYWTIYYQMQTTFQIQGLHMRLDVHNHSNLTDPSHGFEVPTTWLSLFNIVFIIAFVPFLDRLIYPFLDKRNIMPSLRTRILLGMLFSFFSMVAAGLVERVRLKTYWGSDDVGHPFIQYIACTVYFAADMSVFWQIPQYVFIGVSEVLTSIAVMELAYIVSPKSIQSIIMGLFYFSQGVGSLVGMLVVYSLEWFWFPTYDYGNINCKTSPFSTDHDHDDKCHLDYYFFFLAVIQVVTIIIFIVISMYLNIGGEDSKKRIAKNTENQTRHRTQNDRY